MCSYICLSELFVLAVKRLAVVDALIAEHTVFKVSRGYGEASVSILSLKLPR